MEIGIKLREKRGEVSLHLSLILMVSILFLAAFLEVNHVYQVVELVTSKTNAAVRAVAAINGPEVYGGIRESDGTARRPIPEGWGHSVSTSEVRWALGVSLGAAQEGETLAVEGSYRLTELYTQFVNEDGGNLHFTTTVIIDIPLTLGGGILPPVRKALEVNTTYEPKF